MPDDKYKHGTCANGWTWTATKVRPRKWSVWIKDGKEMIAHADFEGEPSEEQIEALTALHGAVIERMEGGQIDQPNA